MRNLRRTLLLGSLTMALSSAACSSRPVHVEPPPPPPVEKITSVQTEVPGPKTLPPLVGRMQQHRIVDKETLLDVARNAGLGFNEVKGANPGVDEWIPPAGSDVT